MLSGLLNGSFFINTALTFKSICRIEIVLFKQIQIFDGQFWYSHSHATILGLLYGIEKFQLIECMHTHRNFSLMGLWFFHFAVFYLTKFPKIFPQMLISNGTQHSITNGSFPSPKAAIVLRFHIECGF